MAKVVMNVKAQDGYLVARAVSNLLKLAADLNQAFQDASMILAGPSGNNTLDISTAIGTATFGAASGGAAGGDLISALQPLNTNLQTFIANNSGQITTLYQGDVN